jgi:hypothetical protein
MHLGNLFPNALDKTAHQTFGKFPTECKISMPISNSVGINLVLQDNNCIPVKPLVCDMLKFHCLIIKSLIQVVFREMLNVSYISEHP